MSVVLNLFTDEEGKPLAGFEHSYNAFKVLRKKRVHYKQTTYTKYYKDDIDTNDIQNWEQIRQQYSQLANYFLYNALQEQAEQTDYGIVRVWHSKYTSNTYTHKGTIYKGQDFVVREAELIGSEDLGVQERLFLHSSYLELLEEGIKPDSLNWLFDMEIQFLKTHTLQELLACLILLEVINNGDI